MLPEAAHLQEEEAAFANRHRTSKHDPALPLYTVADADRIFYFDGGQILEQGSPREIFASPKEARTQQFLERIIEAGRL